MQCSQSQNLAFRVGAEDRIANKKRKMIFPNNNIDTESDYQIESSCCTITGRHFICLSKKDCKSIFQTQEWQPSGSVLFLPLMEDILVNTQNIEQFSCNQGNFFVADENGQYSKTLPGNVLHLWRFCNNKNKLFISRSFFFSNPQDFLEVQQALQQL